MEKLEFYWIVHPIHFPSWSQMQPVAYPDSTNEVATDCWNRYVIQFVLQAFDETPDAIKNESKDRQLSA
jgi:hypothetical protein